MFKKAEDVGGPYSFFLRVVSWASKPVGILARLQFRLPRQKCKIKFKNGEKIVLNLNISVTVAFFPVIVTKKRF